ncbi:MAG: DUF4172 domain-containing protein, partial [Bacteroidota bacterium]
RAIAEKALSQSLGHPTLIALSHTIDAGKNEYYQALHTNSLRMEVTPWLQYWSKLVRQAQQYTQKLIDFLIEKTKFYDQFSQQLNPRQKKVVDRVFQEGIHGFKGGLSADNYRAIAKTTPSTTTRDLQQLVALGAFRRTGQKKGTRYYLSIHEVDQ